MAKLTAVDTGTEGKGAGPTMPGIFEKVFRFQAMLKGFAKDSTNSHFKYKFTSATTVIEAIRPILQELRIIAIPNTRVAFSDGKIVVSETNLQLLDIDDGSSIYFSGIGEGSDNKQAMKANTSSLKYALMSAFFAPMIDDPEADSKEDTQGTAAQAVPPSVRTNRPAPQKAPTAPPVDASVYGAGGAKARQGQQATLQAKVNQAKVALTTAPVVEPKTSENAPIQMDSGFVVTVDVDKVYDGRPSKSGKLHSDGTPVSGPGTVIDAGGTRYDTFDKNLLGIARQAKKDQKQITILYTFNEQYSKNVIAEEGLTVFGEEPQEGPYEDQDQDSI